MEGRKEGSEEWGSTQVGAKVKNVICNVMQDGDAKKIKK